MPKPYPLDWKLEPSISKSRKEVADFWRKARREQTPEIFSLLKKNVDAGYKILRGGLNERYRGNKPHPGDE